MNHGEIVSFLWGVAVLRRLDCVLAPTKAKVLGRQAELRGQKLENLDPQLRRASGFAFYNTSVASPGCRFLQRPRRLSHDPECGNGDAMSAEVSERSFEDAIECSLLQHRPDADLLIGVADDGSIVGIERDRLETDDKFMRHLAQAVRNGLDDRAGTCIDPKPEPVLRLPFLAGGGAGQRGDGKD